MPEMLLLIWPSPDFFPIKMLWKRANNIRRTNWDIFKWILFSSKSSTCKKNVEAKFIDKIPSKDCMYAKSQFWFSLSIDKSKRKMILNNFGCVFFSNSKFGINCLNCCWILILKKRYVCRLVYFCLFIWLQYPLYG